MLVCGELQLGGEGKYLPINFHLPPIEFLLRERETFYFVLIALDGVQLCQSFVGSIALATRRTFGRSMSEGGGTTIKTTMIYGSAGY